MIHNNMPYSDIAIRSHKYNKLPKVPGNKPRDSYSRAGFGMGL